MFVSVSNSRSTNHFYYSAVAGSGKRGMITLNNRHLDKSTTSFKQSNETPNPVKEVTFTDKTTGFECIYSTYSDLYRNIA